MKRVLTIEVTDRTRAIGRFKRAWKTGAYQGEFLAFENMEQMARALTPLRWSLAALLQRDGAMSLRELARRAGRDVKRVHEDVAALLELGLVEKTDTGKLTLPYAEVRTEFVMRRAA